MIVLVDDDIVVVNIVESILNSLGYLYKSFLTIDEVKVFLKISAPDTSVVISDLNLQDTSGLDLMMYVKTTYPRLPFVLMSAETESQRAKQYPIAPDAFLAKPFTVDSIQGLLTSLGIRNDQ